VQLLRELDADAREDEGVDDVEDEVVVKPSSRPPYLRDVIAMASTPLSISPETLFLVGALGLAVPSRDIAGSIPCPSHTPDCEIQVTITMA
jgi:hypothetical protein